MVGNLLIKAGVGIGGGALAVGKGFAINAKGFGTGALLAIPFGSLGPVGRIHDADCRGIIGAGCGLPHDRGTVNSVELHAMRKPAHCSSGDGTGQQDSDR
jgi:hypothetical protein